MPQQVIIDPTKSVWGLAQSKKVPEQEDAASKCSDSDNEEQRRSLDDSVKSGDDSIGNISLSSSNEDNVSNKENIVNDQSDKNTTINKADKKKDDDTKNAETDKPKDENISQSQTDKGEDDDDFISCTNPDNLKRKDEKAIKTRKSNVASGFGRQRTQRQKWLFSGCDYSWTNGNELCLSPNDFFQETILSQTVMHAMAMDSIFSQRTMFYYHIKVGQNIIFNQTVNNV